MIANIAIDNIDVYHCEYNSIYSVVPEIKVNWNITTFSRFPDLIKIDKISKKTLDRYRESVDALFNDILSNNMKERESLEYSEHIYYSYSFAVSHLLPLIKHLFTNDKDFNDKYKEKFMSIRNTDLFGDEKSIYDRYMGSSTNTTVVEEHRMSNSVKCPYCNSLDVTRIGGIERGFSIFGLGMASGKIGKQWHCNSCKSNF